jgi:hypothetical protein
VTGAYLAGLLRDRLSGICRRLASNHSTGLSSTVLATLTDCGNPSSGFFDSLVDAIPTIINGLTGESSSSTAQALLQQGLQKIENATQGAGAGAATTPAPSSSNAPKSSGPSTTTTTTVPPTTTTTTQPCNLITSLLGCKSGSSSSGTKSSSSSGSGSGSGLGGLLSESQTAATQSASIANATPSTTSAATDPAPSLTAPAADLLPPLPQDQATTPQHHHAAHRGLLSQWAHDVAGWF